MDGQGLHDRITLILLKDICLCRLTDFEERKNFSYKRKHHIPMVTHQPNHGLWLSHLHLQGLSLLGEILSQGRFKILIMFQFQDEDWKTKQPGHLWSTRPSSLGP